MTEFRDVIWEHFGATKFCTCTVVEDGVVRYPGVKLHLAQMLVVTAREQFPNEWERAIREARLLKDIDIGVPSVFSSEDVARQILQAVPLPWFAGFYSSLGLVHRHCFQHASDVMVSRGRSRPVWRVQVYTWPLDTPCRLCGATEPAPFNLPEEMQS